MGFLDIENRGSGYIGDIQENWKITYNTSPLTLGTGRARLGSMSFSSRCDTTTKFTIDNYLSVKHYFDDGVTRWLSTFDVNIRGIITNDDFASFSTISRLSQLDVVRQSSANPTGTYQRSLVPPAGKTYTIAGTPYVTPSSATVYDSAFAVQEGFYIYLLASGGHNGEVIHRFGLDGVWYGVYPVYSDATDLAGPDSRYLAGANSYLYVAQVGADRVKRFLASSGAFVDQFGAAGTGNGQFQTISCIAASGNGSSVYVGDLIMGRVQQFSPSGTYISQFGAAGGGTGYAEFAQLNSLNVNYSDTLLYVGDNRARIREYGAGSNLAAYYSTFGGWDFVTSAPYGPFAAGSRIDITFDNLGNAYAAQNGTVYKFVHDQTSDSIGSWSDGALLVDTFSDGFDSQITCNHVGGVLHMVSIDGLSVKQYAGSASSLYALILYYIALAAEDFPVRFSALTDPGDSGNPVTAIPEWRMSVWEALTDLCAVVQVAIHATDDGIGFFDRSGSPTYVLPRDAEFEPVEIDTRSAGQRIEIVNQNGRRTMGPPEVMYSAALDGQKTFSANVGSVDHVTVFQDTYPDYLIQPQPQGGTANPFPNPSAEVNLDNIGYYIPPGGSGTLTRQTTPAGFGLLSGAYVRLQLTTAPSTPSTYISNELPVFPGEAYDFRVWARCTGADNKAILFVDWRNEAGQNVGFAQGPSTTIRSGGWSELRMPQSTVAPIGASFAWVQARHANDGRVWLNGESFYADQWSDGRFYQHGNQNPTAAEGRYTVYDSEGQLVDPAKWREAGGKITVGRGNNPGDIVLNIFGPSDALPNAPFTIRNHNGTGSLSVLGGGVITKPERLSIGTGVPESLSNREVAQSVDSPFAYTAEIAYSEGVWIAYDSTMDQRFKVTFAARFAPAWLAGFTGTNGLSHTIGLIARYKDTLYEVESIEATNSWVTMTLKSHASWGASSNSKDSHAEEIWSGKTAGEFDAFWAKYTAQDFTIAPLMNPYNV